jgi:hypothetical protein
MRVRWIISLAAVLLAGSSLRPQTSHAADVSTRPLTQDQLAIYEDFLSHYDEEGQISNVLGLQPVTVPFNITMPVGTGDWWAKKTIELNRRFIYGPGGCLHNIKLEPASSAVHRLPPEIMRFGASEFVMQRMKAAGTLLPESKRTKGYGPDGWSLTNFTVSEIVFDVTHRYAVLTYSANCNCRGGQGGSILYEHKNGKWRKVMGCADYWVG